MFAEYDVRKVLILMKVMFCVCVFEFIHCKVLLYHFDRCLDLSGSPVRHNPIFSSFTEDRIDI